MNGYRRNDLGQSPASPGWWLRLFLAALFIFCVHYVPVHLAVESHLDDWSTSLFGVAAVESVCVSPERHEGHEHHIPHLASDHLFRLAPQTGSQAVSLDWVTVETRVAALTPQPRPRLFLTERQHPPGHTAPGPTQPRAPPTA